MTNGYVPSIFITMVGLIITVFGFNFVNPIAVGVGVLFGLLGIGMLLDSTSR